ncbi:hypothetical protein F2P81_005817 [Scophthalmus maximus]|uniref:trypsin n=1 Tax=Scophthalmus maximus TaxID=52904 RepID=A0A6A4TAQ1_SCOMX|nr:hypothetical protein F2P81_005817 [Scophthalmus maximus]
MLYMASVQISKGHTCGGFLVSEDFVVTAAHCDEDGPMSVVLGTHNLKKVNDAMRYDVKRCKYPSYVNITSGDDIMLLKLSRKAQLNDKVQTIRLPRTNDKIKEKQKCRVAGWGCNKRGGKVVDVLQVAEVPIVKLEMCKKQWKKTKFDLPANVTCAGGPNKGFCQELMALLLLAVEMLPPTLAPTWLRCKSEVNKIVGELWSYSVVLGADSLSGNEPTKQEFRSVKSIPHPSYDGHSNDIMLLKLDRRAQLTKEVQLISLKTDRLEEFQYPSRDVTSVEYICTVFIALQFFEYLMESKYSLMSYSNTGKNGCIVRVDVLTQTMRHRGALSSATVGKPVVKSPRRCR